MYCHTKTAVAYFDNRRNLQPQLCHILNKMRADKRYCDLELVVSGHNIPAHRNILASRSPFFDAMFSSNFREHTSKLVDLSDVFQKSEILELIINYLYTGKIVLDEDNFCEILNGASHFLLDQLRESCAHFMFINLSPLNALSYWSLADTYNLAMVANICNQMVRARFLDLLIEKRETLFIPEQSLLYMIRKGCLDFLYKIERAKFLLKWLNINLVGRSKFIRQILSDPVLVEKLDLITADPIGESSGDSSDESSSREDADIALDIQRHLEAMLDNANFLVPKLENFNEALIGWHYWLAKKSDDTQILAMYAYIAQVNRWYALPKIRVTRYLGHLLGFIQNHFIFKSQHGFVRVNLDDSSFLRASLPTMKRGDIIRSHNIFIYDGEVFCIMEIAMATKSNLHNNLATLYRQSKGLLKIYNFELHSWEKVCDVPVPSLVSWIPLDFLVIPRDDYSSCFILALSIVRSYQDQIHDNRWRIKGPHLLCLKKKRVKYTLFRLADPPLTQDEFLLDNIFHMPRFVGKQNKLYMYGSTTCKHNRHTEYCDGILSYNLDTEQWATDARSQSSCFPTNDLNCVKGLPKVCIGIGNIALGGVQSFTQGNLYHLTVPCPFVSQFWATDIETGNVQELTPPPTEKLQDFTACVLPQCLIEGASTNYSQGIRGYRNPMLRGFLAGNYNFGSCLFRSSTDQKSSNTCSESSSSCSCTECS